MAPGQPEPVAGKWVGGVLDDVFGGGGHPGQSTFDVDPNAVPESDAEYAAKAVRIAALAKDISEVVAAEKAAISARLL